MENRTSAEEHFSYRYSAQQKKDVEAIRHKYLPKQDDKMEQLRRLDQRVTLVSTVAAILVGLMGALLLGVGLCCVLVPKWRSFFVMGILLGLMGLGVMGLAYPTYQAVWKRIQMKTAPEILRLSDEILKQP